MGLSQNRVAGLCGTHRGRSPEFRRASLGQPTGGLEPLIRGLTVVQTSILLSPIPWIVWPPPPFELRGRGEFGDYLLESGGFRSYKPWLLKWPLCPSILRQSRPARRQGAIAPISCTALLGKSLICKGRCAPDSCGGGARKMNVPPDTFSGRPGLTWPLLGRSALLC